MLWQLINVSSGSCRIGRQWLSRHFLPRFSMKTTTTCCWAKRRPLSLPHHSGSASSERPSPSLLGMSCTNVNTSAATWASQRQQRQPRHPFQAGGSTPSAGGACTCRAPGGWRQWSSSTRSSDIRWDPPLTSRRISSSDWQPASCP